MKALGRRANWSALGFFVIASVVMWLRFSFAFRAPESHDIRYFWTDIAESVAAGARLYEDTPYHFPPPWAWLLLLFRRISREGIPFAAVLRSFLTAIDVCTAYLLYRLARREPGAVSPPIAALLFLSNPVSIWVSSVQGQFDNLSLFFLVAAVLVSREPGSSADRKETPRAGFFLFLSIAAKQVSVFHPLLWLRRRGGIATVAIAGLSTLALLLPYQSQWRAMRDHFLTYTAVPRSYGFSEFVLYDSRWGPFVGALDLAAGIAAAWALSKERLARASVLLFLVLLFFAPGMGTQYLVWPLTFGALYAGTGYFLFTASSILWALGSHFGVPGSGRWMGHLIWLSVAFWAVREIRALREGKETRGLASSRGPSAQAVVDRR